ncbi:superoxide dismutase family protein [Amycolatopsis suaedae]|uniref:Superoxide dismutase family protein n=1 Tax=Amycolatopsis suaedae TaxID=2510978 RepID=A0A4Q7JEL1_9PSEU|nr:superoxide dismutase family protein [Amycolatopsis suaedae]RZQ65949.1 superoxide dismutase family protein [Amycolatopsis suaedae]
MPRNRTTLVLAVAALSVVACGAEDGDQPPGPPAASDAFDAEYRGTLAPPGQSGDAFTYNPQLAPAGAQLGVDVDRGEGTEVKLTATGLLPNRGYAVHAHTRPCGPAGDAAGPHFQHEQDPAATPGKPSTDPRYANPRNEIWLDLRTGPDGRAQAGTQVPFEFGDRAPASVVVHDKEATATAPGSAGQAGGRVACLTVPFK